MTAERVLAFSAGKLAHYKVPNHVHVVDEFPMTVTGKVRKVEMRRTALTILGLTEAGSAFGDTHASLDHVPPPTDHTD